MTIIKQMPSAAYHARPELSNTMMSDLKESPYHLWANHINPRRPPREATPALAFGSAFHAYVLEPDVFRERYAIKPEGMSFVNKEGKAWRDAQTAEIITEADFNHIKDLRAAIFDVPELSALLSVCETETSVFWTDESAGVACRCRPDALHFHPDGSVTPIDLKSTPDAGPEAFGRSVAKFGYHRQAAHYTAGLVANGFKVRPFVFAAVTSAYPFIAVPYRLDDQSEFAGQVAVAELIALYAKCKASNHWPAYGSGILELSLPAWELAKLNMETEVGYA
jgi:exodeoxyribonuclease VIII